jgi:hypothetical protein
MEISRLFSKQEPETPVERFLALQIQEGVVQAAVWQVDGGTATIVKFGPSQSWENEESLVTAVDASLAEACAGLESEPNRVIFGLPEYWIETDKISPEHSGKIKLLVDKLELQPLGFVTTTEAVLQFLKASEGIPPSVVIVELGKTRIGVVVTHLGEILGREEVGRSADLAADTEEGLARIDATQLPSRILIIDGVEPEAQQQLASYSWQEKLPFLHLPKVESLGTDFSVKAVALAGGVEAARSLGIEQTIEIGSQEIADSNAQEVVIGQEVGNVRSVDEGNLGFVVDEDIRQATTETELGEEVLPQAEPIASSSVIPSKGLKDKFSGLSLPKFSLPQFAFNLRGSAPRLAIAGAILMLLVVVGGAGFWLVKSEAQIIISVKGQSITRALELSVGEARASELPWVAAQAETISLEKNDTIPTTGEAVVGEKAAGEITIFNKTDTERNLAAGTTVTSSNGLRFVLEESVSVASRSAQEKEGGLDITFGQAGVKVSAEKIGAEYNISADSSLAVGDFPKSSLEAKAAAEFSGGSSRTVKAVSRQDREDLLARLSDQIKAAAVEAQEGSSGGESKTVPMGEPKIISQSFSKGVGEEAQEVSLTLSAEVNLLRFNTEELKTLISEQLSGDIPSGYAVDPQKVALTITHAEENSDGDMIIKVDVEAQLSPQIEMEAYKEKLAGASVSSAQMLIKTLPNFESGSVEVTPYFPILSRRLPGSASRIKLVVETIR